MKPIYKPAGRALEYSPDALALNIYTGCPHRCYYCFAPSVLRKDREAFHSHVEPRPGIVDEVKRQLDKGHVDFDDPLITKVRIELKNRLIHLCFTCDPYPVGHDTSVTREIIKAIKESGNHVQILTKGGVAAERDFDLLDGNDWFGVTYTGADIGELHVQTEKEPLAASHGERIRGLGVARKQGINTWMSCEPVVNMLDVLSIIELAEYVDLFRIGKLNYHPSHINWGEFGRNAERLCKRYARRYYIKNDLRKEMEKKNNEAN
jgi:DNA repair photolyase